MGKERICDILDRIDRIIAEGERIDGAVGDIRDPLNGRPCGHKDCLNHITHPCEGCGRIGGKSVDHEGHGGTEENERGGS